MASISSMKILDLFDNFENDFFRYLNAGCLQVRDTS